MENTPPASAEGPAQRPKDPQSAPPMPDNKALSYAGLAFVYVGLLTLLGGVVFSVYQASRGPDMNNMLDFFGAYGPPLILIGASVLFSFFGYIVLRSVGLANKQVIPIQDRELLVSVIRDGNTKGLNAYIELSSLSGVTGFFKKIGIFGLPLATIFLTFVFGVLALSELGRNTTVFADLANLTLGAFLG